MKRSQKFFEDIADNFNHKFSTMLKECTVLKIKMKGLKDTDAEYQELRKKVEILQIKIDLLNEVRHTTFEKYEELYPERCMDDDEDDDEDE